MAWIVNIKKLLNKITRSFNYINQWLYNLVWPFGELYVVILFIWLFGILIGSIIVEEFSMSDIPRLYVVLIGLVLGACLTPIIEWLKYKFEKRKALKNFNSMLDDTANLTEKLVKNFLQTYEVLSVMQYIQSRELESFKVPTKVTLFGLDEFEKYIYSCTSQPQRQAIRGLTLLVEHINLSLEHFSENRTNLKEVNLQIFGGGASAAISFRYVLNKLIKEGKYYDPITIIDETDKILTELGYKLEPTATFFNYIRKQQLENTNFKSNSNKTG